LIGAAVTPLAGRVIDDYGHRAGIGAGMGLGAVGGC